MEGYDAWYGRTETGSKRIRVEIEVNWLCSQMVESLKVVRIGIME